MHLRVITQHYAWFFLLAFALLAIFSNHTSTVHAQFLDENVGVRLVLNPTNPAPNTTVEVSLDDYSVDAVGATLAWFIDGVEQKSFQNERIIKIPSGNLGEKTSVRVTLTRHNAPALSSSVEFTPSSVDLILESNTYVPSFYKGRALPSEESELRIIAVVHDGSKTPDTSYTYRWSENGTVLFGGPVKGRNIITLPLSRYGNRDISVDVVNMNGATVGRNSVTIRAHRPEVHFYEESPLRGLSEKEISNPFPLISDEVTIYGEPYFINAQMQNSDIQFTWSINNEVTATDLQSPHTITLRRLGGEGDATIGLRALTTKRIPQLIERTFQVVF